KVLVLGAMAEVGENSDAMHAEVGAYAREQGVDRLMVLGDACRHAVQAFGPGGEHFESVPALVAALEPLMPVNVLVKGSRSARMERVVQALRHDQSGNGSGDNHAA